MQDNQVLSNLATFFDSLTSDEIGQLRSVHDDLAALPAEDLADLSDVLDAVMVNPDLYQDLREAAEGSVPEEYDPQFLTLFNAVTKSAMGSRSENRRGFAAGGIAGLHPTDTITAHITPGEAFLLESRGGAGTVNPYTGNREYFLKSIGKLFKKAGKVIKKAAPIIVSIGATALLGPAGLGLSPVLAGAAGSGLSTLMFGGSPGDALKSAALGAAVGFAAGKLGLPGAKAAGTAEKAAGTTAAAKSTTAAAKSATAAAEPGFFGSLKDTAGDIWTKYLSPSRGVPTTAEVTGSKAYGALLGEGLSPDKAFELASQELAPSLLSQYGPLAAVGIGATALAGGFDEEEADPGVPSAADQYQAEQQQVNAMLAQDPGAFSIFPASASGGMGAAPYTPPTYSSLASTYSPTYSGASATPPPQYVPPRPNVSALPYLSAGSGFGSSVGNTQDYFRALRPDTGADMDYLDLYARQAVRGGGIVGLAPESSVPAGYRTGFSRGGMGASVGDFGDPDPVGMESMSAASESRGREGGAGRDAQEEAERAARLEYGEPGYTPDMAASAQKNERFFGPGGTLHQAWNDFFGYEAQTPQMYDSATMGGYPTPKLPEGWTPQGYVAANPDLAAFLQQNQQMFQQQGISQRDWLRSHWFREGAEQNRPFTPPAPTAMPQQAQPMPAPQQPMPAQQQPVPQGLMSIDPSQFSLFSALRPVRDTVNPLVDPARMNEDGRVGLQAGGLPTTMTPGRSGDPLWEQIMGREYQKHIQQFGKDWNTPKTSPQERALALARMQQSYMVQRGAMQPAPRAPSYSAPSSSSSSAGSVAAGYPGGITELPGARPLYPGGENVLPPPPQYVHQIPIVAGIPYGSAGAGFASSLDDTQNYFEALRSSSDPTNVNAAAEAADAALMMAGGGSPKMQLPYDNDRFVQTPAGPRINGAVNGPGTDTSDNIAAALSPNEFVFTARAVRGAGGGDMRRGISAMYDLMHNLERRA